MKTSTYEKKVLKQQMDKYAVKVKKTITMDTIYSGKLSVNATRSMVTEATIEVIGTALKTVVSKHYPSMRVPIIAGGAVRDMIFGKKAKDYDIFLPTIQWPEDEREDNVLVFSQLVLEELKTNKIFEHLYSGALRKVESDTGEDYFGNTTSTWHDLFYVYENTYPMDDYGIEAVDIIDVGVGGIEELLRIQFIGRPDETLSDDRALQFVNESFDYPLVKCLYDPTVEQFLISSEFIDCLNAGVIKVHDKRTGDRVRRFLQWMNNQGVMKITLKDCVKAKVRRDPLYGWASYDQLLGRTTIYQAW